MTKIREAAGGGTVVEVGPARLTAWINRFAVRNGGLVEIAGSPQVVTIRAANGTTAEVAVPYGPMDLTDREPIEALLEHVGSIGSIGLLLVRAGAHSVGACANGLVTLSSTDRRYVQGRTAAGGSSQQRFARRRSNQRRESMEAAADTAARVVLPLATTLDALVLAGDRPSLTAVMADRRLARLAALPSRYFGDIPEPRRAVLDTVAARSLDVEITVRNADQGPSALA